MTQKEGNMSEMKIIRDEECGGIMMIPLLCRWHITRCNFRDCKEKPNTIITGAHEKAPLFGLCEKHFQIGNVPGGCRLDLVFT